MKTFILLSLVVSAAFAINPESIDQKTCFAFQTGFEFLRSSVSTIFEQYIQRWNEESRKESPQLKNTYSNSEFAGLHFKIKRDHVNEPVVMHTDPGANLIVFEMPVRIEEIGMGIAMSEYLKIVLAGDPYTQKLSLNVVEKLNVGSNYKCKTDDKFCLIT